MDNASEERIESITTTEKVEDPFNFVHHQPRKNKVSAKNVSAKQHQPSPNKPKKRENSQLKLHSVCDQEGQCSTQEEARTSSQVLILVFHSHLRTQ